MPKEQVEEWLQQLVENEVHKVAMDMKFLAKHIQVMAMWELNGDERVKKIVFNEDDQLPQEQARVHKSRFEH